MAETTTRGTGGEVVELTDDPTLQHEWERYENAPDQPINIFAYNPSDPHNGPSCKRCREGFCHHCEPDCYLYVCPKAERS
jgi:hypothetical protein